jgi:hypothetical protein
MKMRQRWLGIPLAACLVAVPTFVSAQNRGVYPLGMSAVNSGGSRGPGFTYANNLLFYARHQSKDDNGASLPVTGHNGVLMDLNTLGWQSEEILDGVRYAASVTLGVAANQLTSDVNGRISGGVGLADTYVLPFIVSFASERVTLRAIAGALTPTGRFGAGATDNVGSGYWTWTFSSGQTIYLTNDQKLMLSAYELYEIHTTQEGTGIRPGDTFDLDGSITYAFQLGDGWRFQAGVVGYLARQTTARVGPSITDEQSSERYAVNAVGLASHWTLPSRKLTFGLRFYEEFANRSTFQGYSLQIPVVVNF